MDHDRVRNFDQVPSWLISSSFLYQDLQERTAHLHTDFDGGDVCDLIHFLHGGVVDVPIVQLHTHASLIGHNVSVGHNQTIIADYEPRAI